MNLNQGWQYYYNPGESSFRLAQESPIIVSGTVPPANNGATEAIVQTQASSSVGLKVFSPDNKRDFVMLKLRDMVESDFSTPDHLRKIILKQAGDNFVSADLEFPLGFFSKSDKFWINNDLDMKDVRQVFKSGKLTLWCIGIRKDKRGKKRDHDKDCDSSEDGEGTGVFKKKKSKMEERSDRVEEIKAELRKKHGSSYCGVQYSLWAEMVIAGTHESKDSPPPVPMFGANRSRGRPNRFEETLSDVAGKIATALSPPPSSGSSPIKSAELRGKYIQQLKEIVNLREIGALTDIEYEEHRLIIVNLMKKL